MSRIRWALGAAVIGGLLGQPAAEFGRHSGQGAQPRVDQPAAPDRIDLAILYAGRRGDPRTGQFVSFLERHFVRVGTTSFESFQADEADGWDVVIFDWPSIYPRDEDGRVVRENLALTPPRAPALPTTWDRPSILIATAGQIASEALDAKFDWM